MERPKHPSYANRPTPTLQLLSKLSKFDASGNVKGLNEAKTSSRPTTPSYRGSATNNYSTGANNLNNLSNTMETVDPALDPNYIPPELREKKDIKAKGSSLHQSAAVRSIVAPAAYPTPEEDYHFGKRILGSRESNKNNELVGGLGPKEEEEFRSTVQALYEGDEHIEKKPNCKKVVHPIDPEDMISPVTGERYANYGNWVEELARRRRAAAGIPSDDEEEEEEVEEDPLMDRFKSILHKRGAKGIIGLSRLFKIIDDDDSKSLSFPEFKKCLKETGMEVSEKEAIMLFKRFDSENSGSISYDEFLRAIAGKLNKKRKRLVDTAFSILDKDGSGEVTLSDIAMVYDVSKHPEFISGKRSKDDILEEFMEGFEVGGMKDGIITKQEFRNYYTNISASIGRDDYFELMIRNAWHISGGEGAAANSSNRRVLVTRADGTQAVEEIKNDLGLDPNDTKGMMSRLKAQGVNATNVSKFGSAGDPSTGGPRPGDQSLPPGKKKGRKGKADAKKAGKKPPAAEPDPGIKLLIKKIKEAMKSRGSGGFVGMQRVFRIMDDDGSKALNLAEFKKAMKEMKMDLNEAELRMLFQHFDSDQGGSIDFDEFVQGVRDPLTERRLKLVKQAFHVIDKDGSGEVDAQEIATMYDASKHPDVMAGRKKPTQVLKEFLDTFDVGGVKDGIVSQQEFINYYTNLGANIDNDDYFELMIRNAWHLSGGDGNAQCSTKVRCSVMDSRGVEKVVELKDDLGLKQGDIPEMYRRLKKQGITDIRGINSIPLQITKKGNTEVITCQGKVVTIEIANDSYKGGQPPVVEKAPPVRPSTASAAAPAPRPFSTGKKQLDKPPDNWGGPGGDAAEFARKKRVNQDIGGIDNRPGSASNALHQRLARHEFAKKEQKMGDIVGATLLDVLRTQILTQGPSGVIELQRRFAEFDIDESKSLDVEEFNQVLKSCNVKFSDSQKNSLFQFFDKDGSGTIDYEELLNGLRGQLSNRLIVLVHQIFDTLDRKGLDAISPQQVIENFDPSRHPKVMIGDATPEEIKSEFFLTFDIGGVVEGMVTRDEFVRYYTNVSCTINDDDYMELVLRRTWHMEETVDGFNKGQQIINDAQQRNGGGKLNNSLAAKFQEARIMDAENSGNGYGVRGNQSAGNRRRPSTAGATRSSNRGFMSPHYQVSPKNEDQIMIQIREIQKNAITYYNRNLFSQALALFEELLEILKSIYPPDHSEIEKTKKSIVLTKRKIEAPNVPNK